MLEDQNDLEDTNTKKVEAESMAVVEDRSKPDVLMASRQGKYEQGYDKSQLDPEMGVGDLKHLPLPPEIRQRIYRYALQLPHCFKERMCHVSISSSKSRKLWPKEQWALHYPLEYGESSPFDLSLLLVSKQTFLEAFHVFYRFNTIYFNNTETLLQFLQNIGYARRQELTDVGFNWVGTESKSAFRLLRTCGNLSTVRFSMHSKNPPGYEALREVRGVRQVIRLPIAVFSKVRLSKYLITI